MVTSVIGNTVLYQHIISGVYLLPLQAETKVQTFGLNSQSQSALWCLIK